MPALCDVLVPGADSAAMLRHLQDANLFVSPLVRARQTAQPIIERFGLTPETLDWSAEITAMIREHHKIRSYRQEPSALVEALREADWVDVSLGLLRAGLPRDFLRELSAAFPNAGFHKRLVQLSLWRLLTRPWSPLPMLRF